MKQLTRFVPAKHGFHFPNGFENWVAFSGLRTPGWCGGMVYAALDYFHAGRKIPRDPTLPEHGSVLSTYIWLRQWTAASEHIWDVLGAVREVRAFDAGFRPWFPRLRQLLEQGQPVMLGLVAAGGDPFAARPSHFVLASGCEGRGRDVAIFVYDPDRPGVTATLAPDVDARRWVLSGGERAHSAWATYFVDLDYRAESPPPSLTAPAGTDWHHRDLSGEDLADGDYRRADFSHAIFHGADLHLADLGQTDCKKADFTGANLGRTELMLADASSANFTGADLRQASLLGANLRGAVMTGARLGLMAGGKATFDGARLIGADLSATDLTCASMKRCRAWGARFNASKGLALDLARSDVHGSDFREAQLQLARFANVKANGADFRHANLHRARLQGGYFEGADFRHSDLSDADFSDANVDGADFTGANLQGANLRGTNTAKAINLRC